MHANMKTPCKTAYRFFAVCKLRCIVNSGTLLCKIFCFVLLHMSFWYQDRQTVILLAFLRKTDIPCIYVKIVLSAWTFSLRVIIKFCTYIHSWMFQNLHPVILRWGKATHRWKEILTSTTAIVRASQFLFELRAYSYWRHFQYLE